MTSGVITSGGMLPGGMTSGGIMPVGTSTSRTVIQNPIGTITSTGNFTKRLIVLDPGSLYFQQFYKLLPIDYKLINHLEQNAYFK